MMAKFIGHQEKGQNEIGEQMKLNIEIFDKEQIEENKVRVKLVPYAFDDDGGEGVALVVVDEDGDVDEYLVGYAPNGKLKRFSGVSGKYGGYAPADGALYVSKRML